MSTINIVKYYFHLGNIPETEERMRKLILLAYHTARDRKIYPKAVFIRYSSPREPSIFRVQELTEYYINNRSEAHWTTTIRGIRQRDPRGLHVTFSYKDQDQLDSDTHVACHGYVVDKESLEFKFATHADEKLGSTPKNKKGKFVWPAMNELWAAPEIAYGHLPRD